MSQLQFLEDILPEGTRHSLRLIRKATSQAKNVFFTSLADMAQAAQTYCAEGWDVYYVTAGLGAASNAAADNAVAKRELYVDVDCGPNKPYESKEEGANALRNFCKTVGLPRPAVIDSGNGLHAHWVFTKPIAVHEWKPLAEALKARCVAENFHVDAACTADIVRVLRVPDTINFKNSTAVMQLSSIKHYEVSALRKAIGKAAKAVPAGVFSDAPATETKKPRKSKARTGQSSLTESLAAGDPNRISKFETIWLKSANGNGCAQIANALHNADSLSEPLWRAALSIAQVCDDRDWAIHAISKDHPGYTPEETEAKAALTKGPYTCETFQTMESAALCEGCPHMGKITSPVQLGQEIKQATKSDSTVVVNSVTYEIPEFPFPYFRGANGGVYIRLKEDADDAKGQELVYPHDLYAYKRMNDREHGDVVCMRHHLPHDGVRDFVILQKEVGALDKFRDRLSEQGVAAFSPTQLQKLQRFVGASIQDLQAKGIAETMYSRFGWTPDDTFVVGNREYTKEGVRFVPVTRSLTTYAKWFNPKGSLEQWKEITRAYKSEAFDLHAFGILCGFGSILMKLSPEKGGVVSYYSKASGTGKTTILRMINSIFGDPDAMMKDSADTHLTKVHRMGLFNGICLPLDEMTNTTPQELSTMLYSSTQGRPRDRMKSNENAERLNELSWRSMSVWTSNTSIEDRLGLIKTDPQGEMARVIEIPLRTPVPDDVLESQRLFEGLSDNYGYAGDLYLRYVIPNLGVVQKLFNDTQELIYSKRKWTQTERFRLNQVICALTAGIITNQLGLTEFNLARIGKKIVAYVGQMGEDMRANVISAPDNIAAFINENIGNMLRIDSHTRANKLNNAPYMIPKGRLVIRYEPDTKDLYIAQKEFNKWCATNYINARELKVLYQETTGHELEVVRKRMGAGWDADFGMVWAYKIKNATKVLGLSDADLNRTGDEQTG